MSLTYLVKARHRLVRTSDLNLEESGFVGIAAFPRTLYFGLLCIVPRAWSTEHILALGAGEGLALKVSLREEVLVWTCPALESVLAYGGSRWIVVRVAS
jgi:hypothetical protein